MEDVHDEDINNALEGFDYLDEMDENHDEGVKEALSSFNYLDDPDKIHGDAVKDTLGKFDYLDDIEEQKSRKSSETSQSVRNEKPSTRPHSGAHIHKEKCRDNEKRIPVINVRENVPKRNVEDVPKLRDGSHEVTNNFNKRIFDEDSLEFNNHRSYPLPEAYLDNRANRPNQFDKNEHEFKAYPPNVRDIRNTNAHILPKIHRNNVPNKLDERKTALFDRTKSEEMVSGFPVGEFILRRTQSEELKHPPTRQKIKPKFEPVPEDRQVDFTEPMKIDYSKKRDQRFDDLGACSVILKVFLILLFGLAAAKITLGVLFWNSCEVDNIIPVCVIASGGVSLFYCVSLFGIDFMRKRFKKTPRALRAVLLLLWVMLLGFIIAGCVLLYPKIKDYAFKDCDSETDCCKRKFILTAFCAIITDIICQFSFGAILCCMK